MIDRIQTTDCVLCGNCRMICPTGAISMSREDNGFFYPTIDNNKCILCDRCEKVCPSINRLAQKQMFSCYAVKHLDEEVKRNSSSGGVFTALATDVISRGGYVAGAAFSDHFKVKHILTNELDDIAKMRGSKYVQSDLGNSLSEIKALLKKDKWVLFTGCPCQCAALKTALGTMANHDKLIVVDFVCHGILSEKLYQEYLEYLERKNRACITEFTFRDKRFGWIESGPKVSYSSGKKSSWPLYEDIYMQGYFQGICMRESCYSCAYKNFHSGSDLTMGDFWGAEIVLPDFYDPLGVSMLTIQSEKGEQIFQRVLDKLESKKVSAELITKYNQGLVKPFSRGKCYEEYHRCAKQDGQFKTLLRLSRVSMFEKCKRLYRRIRRKTV